jgi:hypothetical protein
MWFKAISWDGNHRALQVSVRSRLPAALNNDPAIKVGEDLLALSIVFTLQDFACYRVMVTNLANFNYKLCMCINVEVISYHMLPPRKSWIKMTLFKAAAQRVNLSNSSINLVLAPSSFDF